MKEKNCLGCKALERIKESGKNYHCWLGHEFAIDGTIKPIESCPKPTNDARLSVCLREKLDQLLG